MRRSTYALVLGLCTVFMLASLSGCSECTPKQLDSVDVTLTPQHRDWWCWAATTEMVSQYYGHEVDQCDSAEFINGGDCCTGCTGNCDCWGWDWGATISDIQNNWTHWDFEYDYSSSSLAFGDLQSTIGCSNSPVQVVWWWTDGGGHVVLAYGYAEVADQEFVSYFNPLPVDCVKAGSSCSEAEGGGEDLVSTYEAFRQTAGHEWRDTFSGFRYTGE